MSGGRSVKQWPAMFTPSGMRKEEEYHLTTSWFFFEVFCDIVERLSGGRHVL